LSWKLAVEMNVLVLVMPPPLIGGALSDDAVWCLSVAYIGLKSRTERPRNTKIGTEVAHVTRDTDTTFKVKGQGYQAALLTLAQLQRWAWERVGREKLVLRCRLLGHARPFGANAGGEGPGEERGRGISWRPPT